MQWALSSRTCCSRVHVPEGHLLAQASGMLQGSPEAEAGLEPQLRSFPSDLPSETALEPDIERKRRESVAAAWGASDAATASAPPLQAPGAGEAAHSGTDAPDRDLSATSLEELEAELARRRAKVK